MELKNRIEEMMQKVEPWQRIPTVIDGLFLIQTPAKGSKGKIMVEVNPVNDQGKPMKRRGVFISKSLEVEEFKKLFITNEIKQLINAVEELNGTANTPDQEKLKI